MCIRGTVVVFLDLISIITGASLPGVENSPHCIRGVVDDHSLNEEETMRKERG